MYQIGRVCMKLAGRDAGKMCVITEILENNYVLIDGFTRKKKCNKNHLEPLNKKIEITGKETKEVIIEKLNELNK